MPSAGNSWWARRPLFAERRSGRSRKPFILLMLMIGLLAGCGGLGLTSSGSDAGASSPAHQHIVNNIIGSDSARLWMDKSNLDNSGDQGVEGEASARTDQRMALAIDPKATASGLSELLTAAAPGGLAAKYAEEGIAAAASGDLTAAKDALTKGREALDEEQPADPEPEPDPPPE